MAKKNSPTKSTSNSNVLRDGRSSKSAAGSALCQAATQTDKKTKAEHAAKGYEHLERAWAKLTQAKK